MSTFRIRMLVLYTFLVTLTVFSVAHTWSLVTNPFWPVSGLLPREFELGTAAFNVGLSVAAALTSLFSCWGLAHRVNWSRLLVAIIGWLTLLFYTGIDLIMYALVTAFGKTVVPFFAMVSFKTALLTVLSIAALTVLRSKRFSSEYASGFPVNTDAPHAGGPPIG